MTHSGSTTPLVGPAASHGVAVEAIAHPATTAAATATATATGGGGGRGAGAGAGSRVRRGLLRRCADSWSLYALLSPTFLLLAVFSLVPFLIAFVTSLYDYEVGGESRFVGLANYTEYLGDYTFLKSFGNMLFLTAFHVICVMIVPLVVAKLIFSLSSERASYLYRILFLLPIVVPNVAVYLIWRGVVYNQDGLINNLLQLVGVTPPEQGYLTGPATVLWAIAFIGFPFAGGINILIYYAGLTAIPESVHEAATIDGATGVRKFLLIDVPLVLSQIKLLVMLTIIGGIQAFEGVYILTVGGPGFESMVPGLWMYLNAFMFQRMGYACAIGVILFLLILALTVLNLRYFKSSEDVQAQTT